jgi:hypothetical protein
VWGSLQSLQLFQVGKQARFTASQPLGVDIDLNASHCRFGVGSVYPPTRLFAPNRTVCVRRDVIAHPKSAVVARIRHDVPGSDFHSKPPIMSANSQTKTIAVMTQRALSPLVGPSLGR